MVSTRTSTLPRESERAPTSRLAPSTAAASSKAGVSRPNELSETESQAANATRRKKAWKRPRT